MPSATLKRAQIRRFVEFESEVKGIVIFSTEAPGTRIVTTPKAPPSDRFGPYKDPKLWPKSLQTLGIESQIAQIGALERAREQGGPNPDILVSGIVYVASNCLREVDDLAFRGFDSNSFEVTQNSIVRNVLISETFGPPKMVLFCASQDCPGGGGHFSS